MDNTTKMILDCCCGSMKMYAQWNGRLGENLITMDVRKGDFSIPKYTNFARQEVIVRPNLVADMKWMPFRENVFDAILFDPPHLDVGKGSIMERKYGRWTKTELIRTLQAVMKEFERVLRKAGFLIIKARRKYWVYFETILKNFVFFLPIERRSGKIKSKSVILWAFGQLNEFV